MEKRSVLLFDEKRKGDSREVDLDSRKNNCFASQRRMSEMQKMFDEVIKKLILLKHQFIYLIRKENQDLEIVTLKLRGTIILPHSKEYQK